MSHVRLKMRLLYSSYTFPQSKLIPVFTTDAVKVMVDDVEQVSGVTEIDFTSPVTYQFVMRNGEVVRYILTLDFILIPQFTITTEDPSITEIPSKGLLFECDSHRGWQGDL